MLDACQTFKFAFLQRCVQEGLTLDQIHERVKVALAQLTPEKRAAPGGGSAWPSPLNLARDWVPGFNAVESGINSAAGSAGAQVPGLLATAYLGAPIAAGGLAGYGLAKMQGLNDESPEEVKTQEKIEAYQRAAERAQLQTRLRMSQSTRRPSRPLL